MTNMPYMSIWLYHDIEENIRQNTFRRIYLCVCVNSGLIYIKHFISVCSVLLCTTILNFYTSRIFKRNHIKKLKVFCEKESVTGQYKIS